METTNTTGWLLSKMILLATHHHMGQVDKAGEPYILHVLHVMQALNTKDEELQCIAIGHDLIEDTAVDEEELYYYGMTKRVVEGIVALTKLKSEKTGRYHEYKARVKANPDAVKVKIEDIKHNMDLSRLREVTDIDYKRMEKYRVFLSELEKVGI